MLNHLTDVHFANLVSMLRCGSVAGIIIAQIDDAIFYEKIVRPPARCIATNSPRTVFDIVSSRNVDGVCVAINSSVGNQEEVDGVFVPDYGDVPSLLVSSLALSKVVHEAAGREWMTTFESLNGPLCERIARLSQLITASPQRTTILQSEDVSDEIEAMLDSDLSLLEDVHHSQHDDAGMCGLMFADPRIVLGVLSAIIERARLTARPSRNRIRGEQTVYSALRMAFELEFMKNTEVYWRMHLWEVFRPDYQLLAVERRLEPFQTILDQSLIERDIQAYAECTDSSISCGLLKMDLDYFKIVNDIVMHAGGDEILKKYFEIVKTETRSTGEAYRRGGDEVLVILPAAGAEDVQRIAERIRTRVEDELDRLVTEMLRSEVECQPLTVSIGATFVSSILAIREGIRLADELQKRAKREGRNRVVFELHH